MSTTPSQRPVREWPLLVLTVAVVCAICFPLWQALADPDEAGVNMWADWPAERWGRLLFGPEQIASYCAFMWAGLILLSRYLEMRRQRTAFELGLLPTDEGARILHEDARPLQRKVDQITVNRGPFILASMLRQALGKFASSRSAKEVGESVRMQAEVDQAKLATSMATVHYLAWAIPAIGFLGTVRGLAGSLTMTGKGDLETAEFIKGATNHLNTAFDCTLIALVLSLAVMFLVHSVQRDEESLVIDCQQYCLEHLVNRIYEPEPLTEAVPEPSLFPPPDQGSRVFSPGGRSTRIS